jgi:hypothetical protein
MPEYALIAGTILLAGVSAFKLLGKNNKQDAECGADLIAGNAANCTPGAAGSQPIAQANAPGPAIGHGGNAGAVGPGAGYCTRTGCTDGKHCFVAGTPVVTRDGLQPIESLREGDEVLSADVQTGLLVYRRVTATFETPDRPLVDVHVRGDREPIRATPGHPFYTDRGWVPAASLLPGDRLGELAAAPSTDSTLSIAGVVDSISATPDHATVYNLEVDGTHAYFVGAARVLVHNIGCLPFGSSSTASEPGDGPTAANAPPPLPQPVQGLINNPTNWLQHNPIAVDAPEQQPLDTTQPHQFYVATNPTGWGTQYQFNAVSNFPPGQTPTGEQFPAWVVHTTSNNDPAHIAVDVLPATGGPDIALTYSQSGCCVIIGQDTQGNTVAAHLHAETPITALDGSASAGSGVTLTQVIQHQGALANGGTIQTIYGAGGMAAVQQGWPKNSYTLAQRPTLVWVRKNGQWTAYAQVKNMNNTITVKKVWPTRSCLHMPCVIM